MKSSNTDYSLPLRPLARIAAILALSLSLHAGPVITLRAGPVTAEDLSFYVRAGDTDTFIVGQLAQRKLLRAPSAKQEAALKAQGASEALLRAIRDPKFRVSEAEAIAFEKELEERDLEKGLPQIAVGPVEPEALIPPVTPVIKQFRPVTPVLLPVSAAIVAPANVDDAGAATGTDLIIEKVIIQSPPPISGRYYVWIQAQAGRAAVSFNIPNKAYGNEVANSDVEIPLNLRIRNVRLRDWATVKLQFDKQDSAVRTTAAMKKATARIEITKDPLEKDFSGSGDEYDNFVYKLTWHAEEK